MRQRPDMHELLRIDKEVCKRLMNKLTVAEFLEFQLSRYRTIIKGLSTELSQHNPNYSDVLRKISYYAGAVRDAEHNLRSTI
jgi:hypothetical protein